MVAIDISKHRYEVLIGIPDRKRRRRLAISNTLDDFQRLATALASYDLPVRIGFEATGNYHRALAHHLGQAGFDLKLISSVALVRTREALHNGWDKNDPKDAQVIFRMLEIGAVQSFHDPLATGTADIQELSKTHEIVSRSKTKLWHRILKYYLPLYFPTVKRFHYDNHDQLRRHLADFLDAYNFARRLKTLKGLTSYEFICKCWTSEPEKFIVNPCHQMPGLNTYLLRRQARSAMHD